MATALSLAYISEYNDALAYKVIWALRYLKWLSPGGSALQRTTTIIDIERSASIVTGQFQIRPHEAANNPKFREETAKKLSGSGLKQWPESFPLG
jgi:hypothetical protein